MRINIPIYAILCLVLVSPAIRAQAQQRPGNTVVISTFELALPEDGKRSEFDSLTQLYNTNVVAKNKYVISHKTVRHWWGHNNRDMLQIYEVKSWEDVIKANEENNTLFEKAWPTEAARKEFNKAYDKYFTGKHSDEIYQEVKR